ncbi:MAG TPA: hypothetical protein VJV23_12600 [Candidatus Polarisedimenticolia bacterium]|nr:hypothetical protein [Candidatus Polarisedimenticolia bacterium]
MSRAARGAFVVGLTALAVPAGQAAPADLVRSEDAVVALFSLQTELDVDGMQMERLEGRQDENRIARIEARAAVERLYTQLDELFGRYRTALRARRVGGEPRPDEGEEQGEPRSAEQIESEIEAKERELRAAEAAESAAQEDGRRLREDIRRLAERMSLLSQRIAALHRNLPAQRDSVTGVWDVTFLPSGDRGVFALFQSGTLVTGQYVLDGPFQGSLDGTLIDRKLLLHRIDARLGRSMDLTAFLSSDGQALRGTWENYDLANGQSRTGPWSARRRPPRRGEQEDGVREGAP